MTLHHKSSKSLNHLYELNPKLRALLAIILCSQNLFLNLMLWASESYKMSIPYTGFSVPFSESSVSRSISLSYRHQPTRCSPVSWRSSLCLHTCTYLLQLEFCWNGVFGFWKNDLGEWEKMKILNFLNSTKIWVYD